MKLTWPRTLFSRLMLIWLVGITLVLGTSLALFRGERDRHDRDLLFEGIAREITAAVDVLDRLSPSEREQWVEALGRRRLRLALRPPPEDARPLPNHVALVEALGRALPDRRIAVFVQNHPREHDRDGPRIRLIVALPLADGSPLTIRLPVPPPPVSAPASPERMLAALLALIVGITLLAWIAVRLATRPLSRLAAAARAIGEDPNRPPLDTRGPSEVALAAHAFNQMQERIREHVSERTRILAAISHDLQTPITRLRLRAELVDDETLRGRIQSDLDAMQALVREGLDYARSLDAAEPPQPIDVDSLIAALCGDARDMGWDISIEGSADTPSLCQPTALKRSLWNLIENGVKFGTRVEVRIARADGVLTISIRDHGPGLPEVERDKVFDPFYRTEQSRNRETGGTGLGLTIARNLLRRQGGDVRLANASDGGLIAEVSLPVAPNGATRCDDPSHPVRPVRGSA